MDDLLEEMTEFNKTVAVALRFWAKDASPMPGGREWRPVREDDIAFLVHAA
jgi:hypothetical protein